MSDLLRQPGLRRLFDGGRSMIGDDTHVRFVLEEHWNPALPVLGAIGMNPSTASEAVRDPSWDRWRGFGVRWGFGGLIVVNPVPFRSSSPARAIDVLDDVRLGLNDGAAEQLRQNVLHLRRQGQRAAVWLCGWGDKGQAMDATLPNLLARMVEALEHARGEALPCIAFGLTAGGAPKHVMARGRSRIADDADAHRFDPFSGALGERVEMPWAVKQGRA